MGTGEQLSDISNAIKTLDYSLNYSLGNNALTLKIIALFLGIIAIARVIELILKLKNRKKRLD